MVRSSRSKTDLLTIVSDRIARAFNRSGATRAVALDVSKAFYRVAMSCYEYLGNKIDPNVNLHKILKNVIRKQLVD